MSFERAGETVTGGAGSVSLRRKVGPRFVRITPEQLPEGSFIRLYSHVANGVEVVDTVLLEEGDALPAFTPTPTPIPPPTASSTPTRTPRPTPRPALPSLAGYSPLLAQAASNLPAKYDFVHDGLTTEERQTLDWAESRLFSNSAFLASKWGTDNWPYTHSQKTHSRFISAMRSRGIQHPYGSEDIEPDAEIRLVSAQALILMMREIDIQKRSNGHHVVSWELDSLDRVLDDLGIYTGQCIHCYGKRGYGTIDGIGDNYVPIIWGPGHVHREMLKNFAYFAKADAVGILVRSLMDNDPDDFELLYKREVDNYPFTIGISSFAYGNISFMSQIRLPDRTLVSYPTMAFEMVGNVDSEVQAVERVYDYIRKRMIHFTGDIDEGYTPLFAPHTVTPYQPELGWSLYVGQAGSPSSSGLITGTFRAIGLKAEQFRATNRYNPRYPSSATA